MGARPGVIGSFISLAISKWSAKHLMGVRVIDAPASSAEQWLVDTVRAHAQRGGIGMPEVGIFDASEILTMPLFFASNAIYPLSLMPEWLRQLAKLNPLTYLVDALRGLTVQGEQSINGLAFDCAVLVAVFAMLVLITVKLCPRLAR